MPESSVFDNFICDIMNRIIWLTVCLLISVATLAQTQQEGVVKTRGRMVGGKLNSGSKLSGATVEVKDHSAVLSGTEGEFSFPVRNNTFFLQSVKKQGYQLVDMDVCREHHYSREPLYLVMETPEQLRSDQVAAERKIRRNLQRQLEEKETEIENLRNVSQAEKDSLLRILYQQQTDNERLISDMAKRYSTLDYDQLDEFYQKVSYYIENGELTRADSLLRTRGDINAQVQTILQHGQVIKEQREELQKAESVHHTDIEEAARRCFSYYETFFNRHQNDSAAHYLELRATLDTTNVEWQNDVGRFVDDYLADYAKAMDYYQRCLRQSLLQYGEFHEWTATSYNNIGQVYNSQGDYAKALEYHTKALAIREKVFGSEHPDTKAMKKDIEWVKKVIITHDAEAMKDYVFIATTVEGDTPARQQGLSGEYVVLEFADWTITSATSLFDKNNEMRGKSKDIVVMKDLAISKHHFENIIGIQLDFKKVGREEKERILKAYKAWKDRN